MKKISLVLIASLLLFFLTGCTSTEKKEDTGMDNNPDSRTEFLMGTVVTIKIFDEGKAEVLDQIFDRIEELADKITVNDAGGSEVDKINANAGKEPVKVSDEVFELIKMGKEYSELADGSFDITVGPLTNLWRIGFPDARKPSQEEIDSALPFIDYRAVTLDEDSRTVFLQKEGMALDLGAIAKGYIADEVVDILEKEGVQSAIIDLGGNIYVRGENYKGKPWGVGIQDPFSPRGEVIGKIDLSDKSVVTSGIYERYLEVDGKRYHHILNPKTGYPYDNGLAGVSVITDHSVDGDALSTTLFSQGLEDGLALAEKLDGVEALFVTIDKKVYLTSGLKGRFELLNDDFRIMNGE